MEEIVVFFMSEKEDNYKMTVTVKTWKNKGFLNGDFLLLRTYALELPGMKKFVNDSLLFEWSGKNIEYLSQKKDLFWTKEAAIHLEDYKRNLEKEKSLITIKQEFVDEEIQDYAFKTKPFDHQKKAFLLSREQDYYGLFMEMGTGKTKVIIDTAAYLYSKDLINCLVIVAPNGVHAQWIDEQLPLHLPDNILFYPAIYRASIPSAVREITKVLEDDSEKRCLKVVSFNIDALSHKKGVGLIHKFLESHRCLLVIDESVRIKTPGSLRTKNALGLAALAKYRRIMSGAPITNGYEGLYAQFQFLSPNILGFNSFYTFRNYFCIMGGFEGREVVGYKPNAQQELERKVDAYSFRVTKSECLTLPEKIYLKRYVELTIEQANIYDKLEEDLLTELNGAAIDITIAITKLLRMQQLVCGFLPDAEGKIHEVPNNRITVLTEAIEEALLQPDTKIIIWARFIQDIKNIRAELLKIGMKNFAIHYGEISQKDRESEIQKFKTDKNCKIFLGTPSSGGTGLNLAEASTVIYYSNDFNADTRWQSEDRAHRIGQTKHVTYIDLIARGTTDVEVLAALRGKKNMADAILDNPRGFLTRRKGFAE